LETEERGVGIEVEALDDLKLKECAVPPGAVVALEHHNVKVIPRQEARAAEPAPYHHYVCHGLSATLKRNERS
jgi:hypothetical protein